VIEIETYMKAKIDCSITKVVKESNSSVLVHCEISGRMDDVKNPDAKIVTGELTMRVRPIVAEGLRYGQKLKLEILDE
jgi:hypothetical protein